MPAVARLANERDLDALVRLSEVADPRVYTLPRTGDELRRAIEHSQDSVARAVDVPADEQYLLVLEDAAGALAGVAAIRATAGSQGTFFAFRNDVIHHASRDLKISNNVHVLTLSSDLTGHSQLLSFFVDPRRTPRADGVLLSRARLALAGIDKHRFSQNFFASLAGWCDEGLASPFWDALGRKFFGMEFIDAERAVAGARNRALIVELMPHYPVYVPLLPPVLAAVMGMMGELVFPVLLAAGAVTRLAALGLFFVNAMAVISYPQLWEFDCPAAINDHLYWGMLLLVLAAFGPGRFSLDAWLAGKRSHAELR